MVRLTGRHGALSAYVRAVFAMARPVSEPEPAEGPPSTPREFFLTGVLCHKPPATRLFTFDAFRFGPDDRDRLVAILAGEAGVEHARPRTEGFGFGLRSALGIEDAPAADDKGAGQRIQYRRSCVETVLDLWMPRAYGAEIQDRVADEERVRLGRLTAFADALDDEAGRRRATAAFEAHVWSMQRLLDQHGIEAEPVVDRDASFARFLASPIR